MSYVYRHIRHDKNEPFYIGIGSDDRYKRANELARRSDFWKKIVNKTKYDIEILFDNISFEEAKEKEIEFIKIYGRKDLNTGTLVNMTDGGDGTVNKVITDEYRKNLSNAAKGRILSKEQKERLSQLRKGVPNSLETRAKISAANKGRKRSEKQMAACRDRVGKKNPNWGNTGIKSKNFKGVIYAYTLEGDFIGEYEGIGDCSRKLGVPSTKICSVIKGKRRSAYGYKFVRQITTAIIQKKNTQKNT